MIRKQDILDRAAEWQLRPEVVEKDYVLGWLLAGVAQLPIREHWIFKGGTCIKKCYFETYRFSEDLDFSLQPDADYTQEALTQSLRELTVRARDLSGLQFPQDLIEVRLRRNREGRQTFEGRLAYGGPLAYPGSPKVLIDLTQHEAVLDAPNARSILHPYPDELPDNVTVYTYSFNELLAEKTRALRERSRPRDLYDVVHLLENAPDEFDLAAVRELFLRKCRAKGLMPPSSAEFIRIVGADAELRSEWANMLAHQLPALPDLDGVLAKLPGLLGWIDAPAVALPEARLAPVPIPAGTISVVAPGIRYWGSGLPLEAIRFAGTNRLLVEFDYDGRHRRAEPYSIRRAETTENLLMYAWEEGSTHIKAFNVAKMHKVRPTGTSFAPRYRVEFSAAGPVSIGTTSAPIRSVSRLTRPAPSRTARPRVSAYSPKYVFACPYCEKRFTHTTNDSTLRKHKRKDGWGDCPGRRGHLVQVR